MPVETERELTREQMAAHRGLSGPIAVLISASAPKADMFLQEPGVAVSADGQNR